MTACSPGNNDSDNGSTPEERLQPEAKPSASDDVTMEEVLDLSEDKKKAVNMNATKEEPSDCLVGRLLTKFLEQLDNMTKCPISQERFKHPCIASDNFVYERDKITEWLKVNTTSPITRKELKKSSLKYDHTMHKLVQSFHDFKITKHVLKHLK